MAQKSIKPTLSFDSMDLHNSFGMELPIIGLLSVYKDYYPNLVMTSIPPSKRLIFKVSISCNDVTYIMWLLFYCNKTSKFLRRLA